MTARAVFCIAQSESQALEIVQQLKLAGFSNNDISALLPDKTGTKDFAHECHTKAPEGALAGAVLGGGICAGLGWLAGLGILNISQLHAFITAGPVLSALSAATVGALLGGGIGALAGVRVPEYEARRYEGKIGEGNILLSVHCGARAAVRRARAIFRDGGGQDIAAGSEVEVVAEWSQPA